MRDRETRRDILKGAGGIPLTIASSFGVIYEICEKESYRIFSPTLHRILFASQPGVKFELSHF